MVATLERVLSMQRIFTPWLIIPLLLAGCSMEGPSDSAYVPGPLQPGNCGTPDQFKPCIASRGLLAGRQQPKPTVTVEVLAGATAEPAGGPDPERPPVNQNRY
jgi:hypothetical protein